MEEYFRIGVITTTHGLKGEVKVFPTTEDPGRFSELETCYLKEKDGYRPLKVSTVRYFKNLVILGFEEYTDIEQVMPLKNKELYVDREHAIPLEEGEYYIADILGCDVYDEEGRKLGILEDYLETGAQDVYRIRRDNGKEFLIPAVDEFIREVDVEGRKMVIRLIPGMVDED